MSEFQQKSLFLQKKSHSILFAFRFVEIERWYVYHEIAPNLKKSKFRLFVKIAVLRSQVRILKNNLVRIVLMWLRIINYGLINPNKLPVFIKNLVKNFLHYICTFIVHSNPAHGYLCAPKVLPTHAYAISQYRKTRFILILVLLILVTPTGK